MLHLVGGGSDWYFHDWHATMANTGGLLLQKGSHDFDIINWIVDSKVQNIAAFGSQDFYGGDKYLLDDFVHALRTGEQPGAGGEAGLDAIEVGLTAHEAI